MTTIRLHNTRTRKKEEFVPLDPANVRMYVCGPTVYDRAHIGNARPVVVFDVLYRLLRHVYGEGQVTYVRNFTDVDDKINARAAELKAAGDSRPLEAIVRGLTDETIGWYHADMDALGALRPDHEPRATEYIPEMQEMIAELVQKGFAYVAPSRLGHNSGAQFVHLNTESLQSHSFLSVEAFDGQGIGYRYGELSGRSVEDMLAGTRSEVGEGKRNPMDSVLWKPSTIDLPGWDSPWGFGRPGWHIECSAMSRKLLGKKFDIHGGGLDLLFPHHENELAQCRACDGPGASASYWMHNEMLLVDGKKMSKSLGNFFTVRDLLDKGIPGEVIRFVLLSTHYSKPMDFTMEKAEQATRRLQSMISLIADRGDLKKARFAQPPQRLIAMLSDDLNSHEALNVLLTLDELGEADRVAWTLEFLGLFSWEELETRVAKHRDAIARLRGFSERLLKVRAQAKRINDFSEFDAQKVILEAAGVSVSITRDGIGLNPGPNFDPAKLEPLE